MPAIKADGCKHLSSLATDLHETEGYRVSPGRRGCSGARAYSRNAFRRRQDRRPLRTAKGCLMKHLRYDRLLFFHTPGSTYGAITAANAAATDSERVRS